ncbi:hypothetical protein ES707_15765 [subsurface metagenome]
MNGDLKQNGVHFESQPKPENKLESIGDINRAIKDGDEKYIERLGILADLLSDLNGIGERLIELATEIRDSLKN